MSSSVNGGQVFGQHLDLIACDELDVDRGRYLPTTSVDEMYAELAFWFGVSAQNLPLVLSNIGRFYDAQSQPPPLGLFA